MRTPAGEKRGFPGETDGKRGLLIFLVLHVLSHLFIKNKWQVQVVCGIGRPTLEKWC